MTPPQAQYLLDTFPGSELVLKTFLNNNVDNTWMLKQDDVTLLVEEEYDRIKLRLGGTSHGVYKTGKVKSRTVTLDYRRPSGGDVGNINNSKKERIAEEFNGSEADLYDAFVDAFGTETITADNR